MKKNKHAQYFLVKTGEQEQIHGTWFGTELEARDVFSGLMDEGDEGKYRLVAVIAAVVSPKRKIVWKAARR